ncbi:Protein of unknown function [Paenibacillus sp. PDC88]|nr:Protein of unknown function [Paenibacillus sp. PDC88]SFS89019.1 Protein of unknown function [Paenibacillus sp. 453mf]
MTAWENENGRLYCLRDNKIFPASARDVANIRDFYRLNELTTFDIELITTVFIEHLGPPEVQKVNKDWIIYFNRIFEIKRTLEQKRKSSEEVKALFDLEINNIEEELHNRIEDTGKPYLESLRKGDASFYQDEQGKAEFNEFICTQYFRTNVIKESFLRSMKFIPGNWSDFDPERIWNVLKYVFSTNLGHQMSLPNNNFVCIILKNNTPTPFITGDQPVINTKADYNNLEQTNELELYYPVSAKIALLLLQSSKKWDDSIDIEEGEVQRYNDLIFKGSKKQVYANEVAVLNCFN